MNFVVAKITFIDLHERPKAFDRPSFAYHENKHMWSAMKTVNTSIGLEWAKLCLLENTFQKHFQSDPQAQSRLSQLLTMMSSLWAGVSRCSRLQTPAYSRTNSPPNG